MGFFRKVWNRMWGIDYNNTDYMRKRDVARLALAVPTLGTTVLIEYTTRVVVEAHPYRREKRALFASLRGGYHLYDEAETCMRRLASAMTGTVVQSILTSIMAHCAIGVGINGAEVFWQFRKARRLFKNGAFRYASITRLTLQMATGIFLKLFFSFLFVGHDNFVSFVERLQDMIAACGVGRGSGIQETLNGAKSVQNTENLTQIYSTHKDNMMERLHRKVLENPVTGVFNHTIEQPTDWVKEHRGLPENWEEHESEPTYGHQANHNILAVGTVSAGADVIASRTVEAVADHGIKRATRHD